MVFLSDISAVNLLVGWYLFTCTINLFTIWLAPRADKMNQIAWREWLSERARWTHLARSSLPAVSRKKKFPEGHVINLLLTKFVRWRWLDIALALFFCLASVHENAKTNLANIQPFWPDTFFFSCSNLFVMFTYLNNVIFTTQYNN